jgi:hypothetical protein
MFLELAITGAVAEACLLPGVRRIVLVYVNHEKGNELGSGGRLLTVHDFVQWGLQCAQGETEFLVVLEACYSTVFASAVRTRLLQRAKKLKPDKRVFARDKVGFITSAKRICSRSIAMISKDDALVNLFEARGPEDEWARGFFHWSSMFLRQFNWLLAYGCGPLSTPLHPALKVEECVARMNLRRFPDEHGFYASLVASEAFGSIEFKSFFPFQDFGILDPTRLIGDEWPGIKIGDLIPSPRLGRLFDDVCTLEEEDRVEGEEQAAGEETPEEPPTGPADYLLIPIKQAADGRPFQRDGPPVLASTLQPEPPFVRRLSDNHFSMEAEGWEDVEEDDRPKRLDANHLLLVILRQITNGRITDGRAPVTCDICESWAKYFVDELHVDVPLWEPLGRVARFRSCFESDESFKGFLVEMLGRALGLFPEFQAEYPGVEPIVEAE